MTEDKPATKAAPPAETPEKEPTAAESSQHPARIQVSLGKKPLYFYVNLSKKLLAEHGEVQLSALGFAMSNMVSVAEILKKEGMVVEKKLSTCIDTLTDRGRPRPVRKPKMEVILIKSADFDKIFAEQQKIREAKAAEKAAAAEATEAAAPKDKEPEKKPEEKKPEEKKPEEKKVEKKEDKPKET